MSEMTAKEKTVFKEDVRRFIQCLMEHGFKSSSIARAAGLTCTHRIIHNSFGYKTAVLLTKTYSNNWNKWCEEKKCM